jgi:hypothetical protein
MRLFAEATQEPSLEVLMSRSHLQNAAGNSVLVGMHDHVTNHLLAYAGCEVHVKVEVLVMRL